MDEKKEADTSGSPASSAAPSAMPTGDGSATPGDISPEKTKGRDLAVNDFFEPDDHVLKDGLYNVATQIEKYLDKSLTSSCNKNFGSEYK